MSQKDMSESGHGLVSWAARLSPAGLALFSVSGALLAGLVFYAACYLPYSRQWDDLTHSRDRLERELATRQAALEKHRAVAEAQGAIRAAYQYLEAYLFHENEMPRLAQMVAEAGERAGLAAGAIRFVPQLPALVRENFAEIPFTLSLQGDFPSVLNFLYDFSRLDRFVNITDLEVSAPRAAGEAANPTRLLVNCGGRTYRPLTAEEEISF